MSKLLLVDGDEHARGLAADRLRNRGWEVVTAADLRSAMEIAIKYQPDVIVTELLLDDVAGFQFARTLRSAVEHDVKVIAATSASADLFDEARAAGFDDVWAKPLDVDRISKPAN